MRPQPVLREKARRQSRQYRQIHRTASKFAAVEPADSGALAVLHARDIAVYQPANSQELVTVEPIAAAQPALQRCASLEAGLCFALSPAEFVAHCQDFSVPSATSVISKAGEDTDADIRLLPGVLKVFSVSPMLRGESVLSAVSYQLGACAASAFTAALNEAIPGEVDTQDHDYCLAAGFERLCQRSDSFKLFLRYQAQSERHYRRAVEEFDRLKSLRTEIPNQPTAAPVEDLLCRPRSPVSVSPCLRGEILAPNEPNAGKLAKPTANSQQLRALTLSLMADR